MGFIDNISMKIKKEGALTYDNGDTYDGALKNGERNGSGKYIWNDGDKYVGEWKNGVMHGFGKMKFADGSEYEGQWLNGSINGAGKYIYTDGRVEEGNFLNGKLNGKGRIYTINKEIYEGNFINGVLEGNGKITFSNGDKYEGDFVGGKKDGKGKIIWNNGDVYEGKFINNERNGRGILNWSNGDKYEGNYINDKKSGKGKYRWNNGNIYEGDFINDKRTGKGILYWENGDRYEGKFLNGIASGNGILLWSNGDRYEGDFIDWKRTGIGKMLWKNGYKYEGQFEDGEVNGNGKYTYSDGIIEEGQFKNRELNGKGRFKDLNGETYEGEFLYGYKHGHGCEIMQNGDRYEGDFENGKRHGKGIYTFADGTIKKGKFKDGKFIEKGLQASNKNINTNILNINVTDKCKIPGKYDDIMSSKYGVLTLQNELASGGEGSIYSLKNGLVCKIYKKEKITADKHKKIKKMLDINIDVEGICWPIDIVCNLDKEFVGYIMKKAEGIELQKSIFIKPLLIKNFPKWKRIQLVELCINILEKINELHKNQIVIGDINPLNILVNNEKEVYFVDTDSYQIDNLPCPVGTVNFTAPEIQGKDYKTFLRSYGNEYFAISTLMFMIMLPGKPPYSQQGGSNPYINIKNMDFSYPYKDQNNNKTPEGPWKQMWENIPDYMRKYFFESFMNNGKFSKEKTRLSTQQWIDIMKMFRLDIKNNMLESIHMYDIFPN
ncbi:MAG: protein kinase domain-containing protein [Fusobacteriaceae bacterium]